MKKNKILLLILSILIFSSCSHDVQIEMIENSVGYVACGPEEMKVQLMGKNIKEGWEVTCPPKIYHCKKVYKVTYCKHVR